MAQSYDIFGRRALVFGGAFAADSVDINLTIDCGGQSSCGLITQMLNVQYSQPITRLYEVGTQLTYYIAGRPQGTASIARILGPGTIMSAFYACLGDVCNAEGNDMCFCLQAGCIGNPQQDAGCQSTGFSGITYGMKNVVLQSVGISVAAMDMIINEQLSLFFTSLQVKDDACTPVTYADNLANCF